MTKGSSSKRWSSNRWLIYLVDPVIDNLFLCFTFPPTQHTVSFETKSRVHVMLTIFVPHGALSSYSYCLPYLGNCANERNDRENYGKLRHCVMSSQFVHMNDYP